MQAHLSSSQKNTSVQLLHSLITCSKRTEHLGQSAFNRAQVGGGGSWRRWRRRWQQQQQAAAAAVNRAREGMVDRLRMD